MAVYIGVAKRDNVAKKFYWELGYSLESIEYLFVKKR